MHQRRALQAMVLMMTMPVVASVPVLGLVPPNARFRKTARVQLAAMSPTLYPTALRSDCWSLSIGGSKCLRTYRTRRLRALWDRGGSHLMTQTPCAARFAGRVHGRLGPSVSVHFSWLSCVHSSNWRGQHAAAAATVPLPALIAVHSAFWGASSHS